MRNFNHHIFSGILLICTFCFFGITFKYHVLYAEQMQCFLFTPDYATDTIVRIGGVSEYISRFLTQFFHYPVIGGVIIGLILTLLQISMRNILCRQWNSYCTTLLSSLPSVVYWYMLCYDSYSMTGLVSISLAISAASVSIENRVGRAWYASVMLCIIWLTCSGAAALVFLWLTLMEEILIKVKGMLVVIVPMITTLILFLIILWHIPKMYLFKDLFIWNHYRFGHTKWTWFITLWSIIAALIPLTTLLSKVHKRFLIHFLSGLLTLSSLILLFYGYRDNIVREDELSIITHAHRQEWNIIIGRTEGRRINIPSVTALVNLALASTPADASSQGTLSLLGEKIFLSHQYGPESLMPNPIQNWTVSSEILYNLGMINEAQHCTFEGMMTEPDLKNGVFYLTRLSETNLIAGRRNVAHKYLHILEHTLFYRKWASEMLSLSEDDIESDPMYGILRRRQPRTDFIFRYDKFRESLLFLLNADRRNTPALDYYIADCLLEADINGAKSIINDYENEGTGLQLTRYYREALTIDKNPETASSLAGKKGTYSNYLYYTYLQND